VIGALLKGMQKKSLKVRSVTLDGTTQTVNIAELKNMATNSICILGDVHGEWNALIRKIEFLDIKNSELICVGDLGIGFRDVETDKKTLMLLNEFFEERNIFFRSIRGNHDDPSFFDGSVSLSNLKLQRDYSIENISGQRFGFVGGAISVDRQDRIDHDQYRHDGNVTFWKNEKINICPEKILDVDVLITHTAPTWNGPIDKIGLSKFLAKDPSLWDELMQERNDISLLIEKYKAQYHYCGHFHLHSISKNENCISRILDILEIVEHPL